MASGTGFFPNPYEAEEQSLQRRMALGQSLVGQSFAPIPSQKAGRFVAGPSFAEALAKALQGGIGGHQIASAEQGAAALGAEKNARAGADATLLAQALQGRPAQPGGLTEDVAGNVTQSPAMPAQSPTQSLGQAIPLMSPQMQQMGLQALQGAQTRQDQRDFQRQQLQMGQLARAEDRLFRQDEAAKGRDLSRELVQLRADVGGDRPFYQFLQTPEGYVAGNARTGTVEPVMRDGKPVIASQSSPQLQGAIAGAKAGGKERAEAQVQGEIDLPRVTDNAANSLALIDKMIGSEDGKVREHPGFRSAIGLRVPGLGMIPGTDTAGFNKLLDQVRGGAFLEAFNSLKGGGQITEVEGKKATDAIARMDNSQSEREFIDAANDYRSVIKKGLERARTKAGVGYGGPERRGVPDGIDPALWGVMTPQERALWSQ